VIPGDSLRAVLDSVFAAPAYRWTDGPDPLRWAREWIGRFFDWLFDLRSEHPAGFKVLVAAGALVLCAILVHAGVIFWRTVRQATAEESAERRAQGVEERDADWYLRRADEAARAARYAEALRFVFAGVVLRLEATGAVRRAAGKTPADYAREARLAPADRERLRELVRALYRHVYGGEPCDPADYRRWRGAAGDEWHVAAG
jgi:hypothetical protein